MADLITLTQFTDRNVGSLTAAQQTVAGALITDASALVVDIVDDATVTDSWDATQAGTVPAQVVPVVVAMVRRGLERPHDNTGLTLGDYSYTGASGIGIFASRHEANIVRRAAAKPRAVGLDLEGYLPDTHRDPGYGSWLDGAL